MAIGLKKSNNHGGVWVVWPWATATAGGEDHVL